MVRTRMPGAAVAVLVALLAAALPAHGASCLTDQPHTFTYAVRSGSTVTYSQNVADLSAGDVGVVFIRLATPLRASTPAVGIYRGAHNHRAEMTTSFENDFNAYLYTADDASISAGYSGGWVAADFDKPHTSIGAPDGSGVIFLGTFFSLIRDRVVPFTSGQYLAIRFDGGNFAPDVHLSTFCFTTMAASPPPPIFAKGCLRVENPVNNGYVSKVFTSVDDGATIECDPGHQLVPGSWSSTLVFCLSSGAFDEPTSVYDCEPYSPPPPPSPPPPSPPPPPPYACLILGQPDDGVTTFSDYGYLNSIATTTCNSGFTLVAGSPSRECVGSDWTGTGPPSCVVVDCPTITPPVNGTTVCSGSAASGASGVFAEQCNTTCPAEFTLVGAPQVTCQVDSMWSGPTAYLCSAFSIAASFAYNVSSPATVAAGSVGQASWAVAVRDQFNSPLPDPFAIALAVPLADLPSLATSAVTSTLHTGAGLYTVALAAPTVVGSTQYALGVNGELFVSGPTTLTVVTVAAAPAGLHSTMTSPLATAAGVAFETDVPLPVTVALSDAYGNPVLGSAPIDLSAISIALLRGGEQTLATDLVTGVDESGRATVTGLITPTVSGAATVRVTVGGVDVVGSPVEATVSRTCTPGSFVVALYDCAECGPSSYSTGRKAVACTPCPAFTTAPPGSSAPTNCTCEPGTWHGGRTADEPCALCPNGAVCAGGSAEPAAGAGFAPSGSGAFIRCPVPAACLGAAACAPGYEGALCATCSKGYYRLSSECRACSPVSVVVIVIVVVAAFAIVGAILFVNVRGSKVYGFASFAIAVNTLQGVAIYGSLDLGWPGYAKALFNAVSVVNLNLDLTSPECTLGVGVDSWTFKWILTMVAPVLVLVPLVIVTAVANAVSNVRDGRALATPSAVLWAAAGRGYVQLVLLMYLPLVFVGFSYVNCTDLGSGIAVMTASPETRCYTAAWAKRLPWILTFAIAYALAIPGAVALLLVRARRKLDEVLFGARYAFLVANFAPSMWAYEIVVLGRKLTMVMAVCAVRSPTVKAFIVALLYIGILAVSQTLNHRPWAQPHHNVIDALALLGSVFLLLAGATPEASGLATAIVVVSLTALLLLVIAAVAFEVWIIRSRDLEALDDMDHQFDKNSRVGDEHTVDFGAAVELTVMHDAEHVHQATVGPAAFDSTDVASLPE